jgi:transcriptional regulator with XRE-family HTH domain
MSIKETFSERLRALRKEINISQEAFAQALGVARATLSYYENGERTPDIYFLHQVCEKTGCSVEYMMGYSDNMKSSYGVLGAETQLSDKAIDSLMKLQHKDIMNFVLEHPQFPELIRIIKILSFHTIGKDAMMRIDENFRELKLFQAAGIIREMAKDAYENPEFEKSPLYTVKMGCDQEAASFTIDTCEIEADQRKMDFFGKAIESDLKLSEILRSAEDDDLEREIAEREKEEAERAKSDPVLRFRLRMQGTDFDSRDE